MGQEPFIHIRVLLDTDFADIRYPAKINYSFLFLFLLSSTSPVLSLNFLYFLDEKVVVIAHIIYNFVYTATRYPENETGYPAGYQKRLEIRRAGYLVQP